MGFENNGSQHNRSVVLGGNLAAETRRYLRMRPEDTRGQHAGVRVLREPERERLRSQLEPKCMEILANARAAVGRGLASTSCLTSVQTMRIGEVACTHADAVARFVSFVAEALDRHVSLEVVVSVECYIDEDHLCFHRKPIRINGRWRDAYLQREVRSTFKRVRGQRTATSYNLDQAAFSEALETAAKRVVQR